MRRKPNKTLKTLCDFINPNTHRSFTLSAALIISLKESRIIRSIENVQKGGSSTLLLVSFPAKERYVPIYKVTNSEVKVMTSHLLTYKHLVNLSSSMFKNPQITSST